MKTLQPVRIVGGGLAGLSLGIALSRAGVPTAIYETGDYPRHRVCGEFITGLTEATIEKLGIGSALADAGSHSSVTWFARGRAVGRQRLPSPARAVSRFVLDARLAELFAAGGGELITHSRRPAPCSGPGWVETSGRKPKGTSPWIGIKLHARNLPTSDDLELHLGDEAYVGLSSVGEGWINLCGLFHRRPGLRFDREEALSAHLRASGLDALAERLATAQIRSDSLCTVAGLAFARQVTNDEGVRLGDACAMIPPFTGNGMAMAFRGAALAHDPLVTWSRGEDSWSNTARTIRKALQREFRVRLNTAALLHPFLTNRLFPRFLEAAARSGLIPLSLLYRLLH